MNQRFKNWIDQYENGVKPWAEDMMSEESAEEFREWCLENLDLVLFGFYFAAKRALE